MLKRLGEDNRVFAEKKDPSWAGIEEDKRLALEWRTAEGRTAAHFDEPIS